MLKNKRALITGSNGGIGSEISKVLFENGSNLVLLYNKNRDKIDKLISDNHDNKSRIETYQVDLTDSIALEKVLKKITESERVDIFIHSVSLPISHKSIMALGWNDYQSHIDLQTKSFIQIIQSLIPSMKENKGKIINILTAYVVGAPPNHISNYIMSKYSLLGLSKALAVELGQYGITVNCVSPSITETPLTANLPSKIKEIAKAQTPIKQLTTPKAIANVV